MQEGPLVSIGILSYNRPDDLRRAVQSVIDQTYGNLEILISDNGSQVAETRAVIAAFAGNDKRIRTFLHEVNRGPQFNFEFLVNQATGKYFSWLADDDAYSPTSIADCVQVMEAQPSVVLATNMPIVAGSNRPLNPRYIPHTLGLPLYDKYALTIRYLFEDINLFYYGLIRLDCLKECHLYLKKLFGGDLLLPLELLSFGDIAVNQERPGYVYTVHAEQTSASTVRYRKITLQHNAGFIERRAFFTAYIFYMRQIILNREGLSAREKRLLVREVFRRYIAKKRFHLLKYDLGVHRIVGFLKKAFAKS